MEIFLSVCLLFCLTRMSAVETIACDSSNRPISFENADITIVLQTISGRQVAQAFNATSGSLPPHKMRWVSLGVPRLLARTLSNAINGSTNSSKPMLFEFAPGGFYVYIETLSSSVAAELAKEASAKYDHRIEASQFLPIDKHIGSISCIIDLFDSDKKEFTRIFGEAEIIGNPVVIFFRLPNASDTYEKLLTNSQRQVIIKCNVESRVKERNRDILTIASSALQESNPHTNYIGRSDTTNRLYKPTEDGVFIEFISLSTEEYRVSDIFMESYEFARRSILQEVLQLKDSLNKSILQQLLQSEIVSSNKIACSFALQEPYLTQNMNISNPNACSQFIKPRIFIISYIIKLLIYYPY